MGIGVICTSFWRYGPGDEFLARPLSIGTMTGAVGNWKGPVRLLENRGLLRLSAHRGRDEPSASKRGLRLSRLVQGMSRLATWLRTHFFGEPVVGDDIDADLGLGQILEPDR